MKELSRNAIKQAIDDLPIGLCFADAIGRIMLINRAMGELIAMLTGSYPQMLDELNAALCAPQEKGSAERIESDQALYRFPDGKVWRFQTAKLPDRPGFTQTTAQNVTELYDGNAQLAADNMEMQRVNEKLRVMYERLADHIREQETLNLKMRVHDNIGASLITISEMMGGEDMGKQLAALQDAVSYFTNDIPAVHGTFDEMRQRAAEMNVTLALDGYIPSNDLIQSVIVAAARECVTNCVKHAGGSRVTVEIEAHSGFYTVTITNNGNVPQQKITEGGGLSNLRRSVEAVGGEMYLAHKPAFALILNLPREGRGL